MAPSVRSNARFHQVAHRFYNNAWNDEVQMRRKLSRPRLFRSSSIHEPLKQPPATDAKEQCPEKREIN